MFGSAVSSASGTFTWLAVVGVLGSVVSFGYYGGVLKALYLDDSPAPAAEDPRTAPEGVENASEDSETAPEHAEAPSARAATGVVAAIALVLLAGGILPLFLGLDVFAVIGR